VSNTALKPQQEPCALKQPAYAAEVRRARAEGKDFDLCAHIGRTAWQRARRHGPQTSVPELWRLVVPLDTHTQVEDYDFTVLDHLTLTLNATDCDYVIARRCAVRMCEHGAALVILHNPGARRRVGHLTVHGSEWFRCGPR
jgi:hypothetical protein